MKDKNKIFEIATLVKKDINKQENIIILKELLSEYIALVGKMYAHKDTNKDLLIEVGFNSVLKMIDKCSILDVDSFIWKVKKVITDTIRISVIEQGTSYIPPHIVEVINNYVSFVKKNVEEKQYMPTIEEIAAELNISVDIVKQLEKYIIEQGLLKK